MTTKTALFALLAMWGVGTATVVPSFGEDATLPDDMETSEGADGGLTDRVWTREDDAGGLPGVMRIFLSDGTMVSDSCWETHRLSDWTQVDATHVRWNEDGMDINAEILTLSPDELVLKLDLRGGPVEERYVAATVPYLCPDMPA